MSDKSRASKLYLMPDAVRVSCENLKFCTDDDVSKAACGGLRNFPICVAVAASASIPDVTTTTTL
jgi:hypothetical protein